MTFFLEEETVFPCPSKECWEYTSAGVCQLKSDGECTRVTCGSTTIQMEMTDDVFSDSAASMELVEPTLTKNADSSDLLMWSASCKLGDKAACNSMTYTVKDNR